MLRKLKCFYDKLAQGSEGYTYRRDEIIQYTINFELRKRNLCKVIKYAYRVESWLNCYINVVKLFVEPKDIAALIKHIEIEYNQSTKHVRGDIKAIISSFSAESGHYIGPGIEYISRSLKKKASEECITIDSRFSKITRKI
jgi:hypothetical protein